MTKKLKWNDVVLSKSIGISPPELTQGIKKPYKNDKGIIVNTKFYDKLNEGFLIYVKIQNGDVGRVRVVENKELKILCACMKLNRKAYTFLQYSGVKKVGDLLEENTTLEKNWLKVKDLV